MVLGTARLVPLAMRTLRAATASQLTSLASELHDSWIELPEVGKHSPPATIRMVGRLELGDVRPLRSWGPFVRVEVLKRRLELTVEAVLVSRWGTWPTSAA